MKEFIEYLLKMIIDFPDRLEINKIDQNNITIMEITVDPTDIGKIIGKQGRTIKAIRTIVNAANIKEKNKIIIEIVESKKHNPDLPINF